VGVMAMEVPPADGERWRARIGERVVVRRRLPDGSATDVVGPLLAVRRTGSGWELVVGGRPREVSVPLGEVVVGKVVPPRPVRAAPPHRALTVADLERVAALHWRAPETEALGGWLLRAGGGFTGRANSALAAEHPRVDLRAAIDAVRAWYTRRGLPPLAAVPRAPDDGIHSASPGDPGRTTLPGRDAGRSGGRSGGDEELAQVRVAFTEAGWAPVPRRGAFVLTAATVGLATGGPPPPEGLALRLDGRPSEAWISLYHYRGAPLPPIGRELLVSAPAQVFASVVDGDRLVAVARGSLGGGWAGITAVEVDEAYRRRGLARLLLARLAAWGTHGAARSMFVQVGETNLAALALYESAGFQRHHRYDYLTPA
jgi:GNAT superfamily N-acetyltransferase